ncbi:MAG: right-handed parallel beta-helix repeat-containing protein [Treponema sp.]|jgi:hypothetical protein|nr:right-handed parallel beta-helix repeat-containing protein [Treponema sp.]
MKKYRFIPALLSCIAAVLLAGGCFNPTASDPRPRLEPGQGMLVVSLGGNNVLPSLTMLPQDPQFTRYELEFFTDITGTTLSGRPAHSFTNSSIQLELPGSPSPGTAYYIRANGYNGAVLAARSDVIEVAIIGGNFIQQPFVLKPYMDEINGVLYDGFLDYSLSWDGLSRMPARAELKIEHYGDHDGLPGTDFEWYTIPPSLIPGTVTQNGAGTILLYSKDRALSQLTGSLSLPPGAYKLTVSVTMDEGAPAVSRTDAAHIYSTLTTPAAFHYGGGDLFLSNTSPDSGAAFITGFTFTETPNATTVIGSEASADGTRLIMIMVPADADPKHLTPQVTCADGSFIVSPAKRVPPAEPYLQGEIDFSNPTIWTAQAKNGATQRYTVVVTVASSTDCLITEFSVKKGADGSDIPGSTALIDQKNGAISVVVPNGTKVGVNYSLRTVFAFIGNRVVTVNDDETETPLTSGSSTLNFKDSEPPLLRVYANTEPNSPKKDYALLVTEAVSTTALITRFAVEGYPDIQLTEGFGIDSAPAVGTITGKLPYGVSRANLKPLIQFTGKSIEPLSGTVQNFTAPVLYTVTAWDGSTKKTYQVKLTNEEGNTNTGIFDFEITYLLIKEIPYESEEKPYVPPKPYTGTTPAKVVIGQKARADGKIPIVIQVPYNTDERRLIPKITLAGSGSAISPNPVIGVPLTGAIPFGNGGNSQEAVYTVTSQAGTTQDYVVVVSAGGRYLYVNATGDDGPDYYQGMTEDLPYKTLAKAVNRASGLSGVDHIFVTGELNAASESTSNLNTDTGSVITLNGTGGKKITVTGTGSGATFRGTFGKRVLSVTGGAKLAFENITVTGGSNPATYDGNGGGIYIAGSSTVKFSGGSITGNTAVSGGGVYVEGPTNSEFDFMGGTISNNTATGNSTTLAGMGGGGGVYVKDNALFWLAGGTVSNNTASKGAGGGVLVNGASMEDGFIMSGGTISNNRAPGGVYPHGGGGVYLAWGTFSMQGGSITGNYSNRQGGGVFVHWGNAIEQPLFIASGDSLIIGNDGVGSSKGICNRGETRLMDRAQTDTAYIWDYDDSGIIDQRFFLTGNARIGGVVLAYSKDNINYLEIADDGVTGADQICRIDLEGHLTGGLFKDFTPDADWLNKKLIYGAGGTLDTFVDSKRIVLGTFTGNKTIYLTDYKINVSGTAGTLTK